MKAKVAVVIPIYKAGLTRFEKVALEKCFSVLAGYPKIIVAPQSLQLQSILGENPVTEVIRFDDGFFKGIAGYNRLMMSHCFYNSFRGKYEYMLIYQLDAYIFNDELLHWCEKGYDYVGAPWIPSQKYEKAHLKYELKLFNFLCRITDIRAASHNYYQVGNGGFSLRKVDTFHRLTLLEKERINYFLSKSGPRFHEDVFWGVEMVRCHKDFLVPKWDEALSFAFDIRPWLAYKYANNKLSMGCHGWYTKENIPFWEDRIHEFTSDNLKETAHYRSAVALHNF
jgi:hypothetical protein